jgi:glycosyltransferase involved in cell wall biosynthesis
MENIKISVIVPVYNVEQYLERCLSSLVDQTLEEIEIIVVNDGTPDNSQSIIDNFVQTYPNKIVPFKKENGGLSSARNYGIVEAHGEYIGFVDSDDFVELDMFEKMYLHAKESDADIVVTNIINEYHNNVVKKYLNDINIFGKSILESPQILLNSKSYACNKIYRTKMWKDNNFEFPLKLHFEDSYIIYNVLACANKVECVNIPMYHYIRSRTDSITNTLDNKIFDIFHSCNNIIKFYKEKDYYNKLYHQLETLCIRHIFVRINILYNTKYCKLSKEYFMVAFTYLNQHFPNWEKNEYFFRKNAKEKIVMKIKTNRNLLNIYLPLRKPIHLTFHIIRKIIGLFKKRNWVGLTKEECKSRRETIQKCGYQLMGQIGNILSDINVTYFADFGTLLGFIREKGFIKHDIDIDIGIICDVYKIKEIVKKMEENGFVIWREYTYKDKIVEHSFKQGNIKVDFNYYYLWDNKMKTWLFYKKPKYKYKNDNERHIVEMNYSRLSSTEQILINEVVINIPNNYEQLLIEKYGENWKIPDENWIYWQSPAATTVEGLGTFRTYNYFNFPY